MFGAGYIVNINDIAGPYSGIVFGISNTISCLAGIIAPNLASSITKHVRAFEFAFETSLKKSVLLKHL